MSYVRLFLLTLLVPLSATCSCLSMQAQQSFYVDPVNGSDQNNGASAGSALKTISAAQSKVRLVNTNMSADIDVYLLSGTFTLPSTVQFTNADSGTNGHYVRWQNYNGGTPVISGGKTITGWTQVKEEPYFAASVPTPAYAAYFRQLYVNGNRIPQVTHPFPVHATAFQQASEPDTNCNSSAEGDTPPPTTYSGIQFSSSDLPAYARPTDVSIFHANDFKADYIPVLGMSTSGSTTTFTVPDCFLSVRVARGIFETTDNWFLFGGVEDFHIPGQWALDQGTHTVYYWPNPGEDINTLQIVAPVVDPLMSFVGASASSPVANISFQGITFEYGNYLYPSTQAIGGSQAETYVVDAVVDGVDENQMTGQIRLDTTSNLQFIRNVVRYSGSGGIAVYNGAQNTTVQGNIFSKNTAAGVIVGLWNHGWNNSQVISNPARSSGTIIADNVVVDTGQDYLQATGISTMNPLNTTILHNVVSGTGYMNFHQKSEESGQVLKPDNPQPNVVGNTEIGYNNSYDEGLQRTISGVTCEDASCECPGTSGACPSSPNTTSSQLCQLNGPCTIKIVDNASIYSFGWNPGTDVHDNYMHNDPSGKGYYNDNDSYENTINHNVTDTYLHMRAGWDPAHPDGPEDCTQSTPNNTLSNNYSMQGLNPDPPCDSTNTNNQVVSAYPSDAESVIAAAGLESAYQDITSNLHLRLNSVAAILASDNKTVNLYTNLTDDYGIEAKTVYTWSYASSPSGATMPTISQPAQNSDGSTSVVLSTAGAYTFALTVKDAAGNTATEVTTPISVGASAPAVPAGLQAEAFDTSVALQWSAPTNASTYTVSRSTTSGGPYTAIANSFNSTSFTDTGLDGATTYYYVVSASNGGGTSANSSQIGAMTLSGTGTNAFANQDVGDVGVSGNTTYSNGVYTVVGSGTGIYQTADSFQFSSQAMTGDGTAIVRLATYTSGKTGLMMRATLNGDSPYVDMVNDGTGAKMEYRSSPGISAASAYDDKQITTAPYWYKLSRVGDTFTGSISPDGVTWTVAASVTVTAPETIYVGLALSAQSKSALATATFDSFALVPGIAWSSTDVGITPIAGATTYSGSTQGSLVVDAAGGSLFNTADQIRYTYLPLAGDGSITAKVDSVASTDPWSEAGVEIRETPTTSSAFAAVAITYGEGTTFQYRDATGATEGQTNGGSTAPYWVRLVRSGNTFTAYTSSDGSSWTVYASRTITMATNVYIGVRYTSHQAGILGRGVLSNIGMP